VWEATEALANGDKAQAVEELYDCISVLLRTVDVLEGRQKLGRPKEAEATSLADAMKEHQQEHEEDNQ